VLVCLWKDTADQTIPHVLKLNHYSNDPGSSGASSWYVADVFDHHLKRDGGTEFFKQFNHLIISGDHGPHFISIRTTHYQSTFFEKYGKTVHCLFLCSYHAYNRCDGAGVETKRICDVMKSMNKAIKHSALLASCMNLSNYGNSVGIHFPKINLSDSVFPRNVKMNAKLHLNK
jgi:hypothetical protein